VDPTVTATGGRIEPATTAVIANTADGTDLRLGKDLVLRFRRCLADPAPAHIGAVSVATGPLILLLNA
jgi:hypothetical protein